MRNPRLLALLLLATGTILAIPAVSNQAHAQFTGTVCIIPSGSTSCPSTAPTITGTAGTQLRVAVFLQNSDGTNGFDITLLADHTILKPAGADLTGTVLIAPQTVVLECLGGVLVKGNVCSSTDTVDTLHFAALGAPGQITFAPTTGLLFTAIYNVTGTTTGIPLGYQTGCTGTTSVPGTCITIANGTPTPDPENALAATFTTGTVSPDFSISSSPSTLTIARGAQGTSTIGVSSLGGFVGTVSLSASLSPSTHHGPTATLSPASLSLSAGGSGSSLLTVSTVRNTPTGTYTVTVTGTSGNISHSVAVTVTVTR